MARQPLTKGERTRASIVREAAELFNTHGFAGTSLSDVLAATGLEKGGLYNHFPGGKVELAEAALTYALRSSARAAAPRSRARARPRAPPPHGRRNGRRARRDQLERRLPDPERRRGSRRRRRRARPLVAPRAHGDARLASDDRSRRRERHRRRRPAADCDPGENRDLRDRIARGRAHDQQTLPRPRSHGARCREPARLHHGSCATVP